jgi:hypothetical protein
MMTTRWFVRGTARAPVVVLSLVLLVSAAGAGAAQAASGVQDYSYEGAKQPTAPSGEKPQSKLWFNDGSWWGWMWSTSTGAFDVQRFDVATGSWIDSGVAVETRPKALGDVLWDGTHLYALSAIRQGGSASDTSVRLYRLSYHSATQTYSLDSGFPVSIFTPASSNDLEAAILDKDSQGTLWATFTYANNPGHCASMDSCPAGRSVLVTHSSGSDVAWIAPFALPVPHASNVSGDDISTIVHFQDKIGVLFSDQSPDQLGNTADYFAWHTDGAPDTAWTEETPMIGPLMADDHLNLKAAPDGRVYAAVKTSRNDALTPDAADPMVLLLERTTDGIWHQTVFDTVASQDTRSQIVLDPAQNLVYQFATYPPTGDYTQGGWIYCKAASMDAPSFPAGRGTSVIQLNGISDHLNNFSSTKQTVGPGTGLLGIATDDETKFYAHTLLALTATPSCAANPPAPADPPVTPPVTPPTTPTSPPTPVTSTPAPPIATSEIVGATTSTPSAACAVSSSSVRLRSLSSLLSVVRRSAVVRLRVSTTCAIRLAMAARLGGAHGTVVASASVKLKAGQTRVVSVRLTPAGRRLLAHRLRARLIVITRTPAVKATTLARTWATAIAFT